MSIDSVFNPSMLTKKNWLQMAKECDINTRYLLSVISEMADALLDNIDKVINRFEENYGSYPALQRVKQCQQALKVSI